jgi:dTDP-4-amino-4,6-dideoxygalactose transaminase
MLPMVDLKIQYQKLKKEIDKDILNALTNTQFILGPNVSDFENEAASYLGVKHAISVANGTEALHLALLAAGIGSGDEVITSAFTFIATAEAINYTGAKVKFADIDDKTFNLKVSEVEKCINKKTKAILAVHLFGQPADIDKLQQLCDKYNLILIEDAAQSFGASINNQQTGSLSLAGCFSFFPSKNLGCYGDGGMVTTNDNDIAKSIKSLRNHGSSERYHHHKIGYNSRLDELQAVILRIKLKYIDRYNANRRRVAKIYTENLKDVVITPFEDNLGTHVYHQYTILSDNRDLIAKALNKNQISSAIYYPIPLHKQDVYQNEFKDLILKSTESVAKKCISLPIFPELKDEQIYKVINTIKSIF